MLIKYVRFTQCITFVLLRFESHYGFRIQRVKLHRINDLSRLVLYKVGCRGVILRFFEKFEKINFFTLFWESKGNQSRNNPSIVQILVACNASFQNLSNFLVFHFKYHMYARNSR